MLLITSYCRFVMYVRNKKLSFPHNPEYKHKIKTCNLLFSYGFLNFVKAFAEMDFLSLTYTK